MSVAPTAIALGRFGTYDALAGAAFMLGVMLLMPDGERVPRGHLLVAAALLFTAFLAKYLVAIYFPFICLYVVLRHGKHLRAALHETLWFVVPLSAACAAYALMFLGSLQALLTYSVQYGDLKSAEPLRDYILNRPEVSILVAAAAAGARHASWRMRLSAAGGAAIIVAFQIEARADFDFWKHSIYLIFFLAPFAAMNWVRIPQAHRHLAGRGCPGRGRIWRASLVPGSSKPTG